MRLVLVVLLAASTWATAWGTSRSAVVHATLLSSEPAAKSRLPTGPRRVRLVFSEPIEGTLARITIVPAAGTPIVLHPASDPRDVHAVVAPVDSLGPGAYRVDWRVVSADGHPVEGTYAFAVGDTTLGVAPAAGPPAVTPADTQPHPAAEPGAEQESETWGPALAGAPVIPAVLRGAGLGALAAAAGMLLMFVVSGPGAKQATDLRVRRTITLLSLAGAVLLLGHLTTWLINTSPEHTLDTTWAGAALGTSVGKTEMWRTGLAVLALWAWWLARRPGLALAFAVAALAVSGAVGHPAAMHPVVAVPAKAAHLLATGVWFGGLLWLVVRPAGDRAMAFSVDAQRVSSFALISVIVIAASGVLQALLFLPTLGAFVTSAYGRLALAKVAGLVALIAFGAYNRQRLVPRLVGDTVSDVTDTGSLRTSVRREIVVMIVVILIGGLLAYVPPPGEGMDDSATTSESTS